VQTFTASNLQTNRYFQLALSTNAGFSCTIADLAWSNNGLSFTSFSPLYFRYTIPTGVPVGKVIKGSLIANDNGANSGGVLEDSLNRYQLINRDSLSVDVPTAAAPAPLPVLGAAGFFAFSRRLRRRIGI
jgi:hypothetical protein